MGNFTPTPSRLCRPRWELPEFLSVFFSAEESGLYWGFFSKPQPGSAKLSTTTAREQNRALGPQVYGRYRNPEKHRKIISIIAFARLAKIWSSAVVVDSSVLPANPHIQGRLRTLLGILFETPTPTYKANILTRTWPPKLPNLPCFEASGVISCPDVCSDFCLVCGGRGSLVYFRPTAALGCTPRGSCNRTLLRRVLRRFFSNRCFLEGFLEGAW